ncbi:MAG: cupredoxin domain-containing protein [Nitrososphaerales archaeon]
MTSTSTIIRPAIIIAIVTAAALVIVSPSINFGALNFGSSTTAINCNALPTSGSAPGQVVSNQNASTVNILIVESDPGTIYEGLNGSAYHISVPWPVIQVHEGQKVVINVINCASSEPHGFAVAHYFDSGFSLQSGHSYALTFVANEKGTFRIFCSIFCAIHPLMQNGALIVS